MQCRSSNWKPNKLANACSSISRGTRRSPSPQIPKSTTRKFGCADSFGTSKPFGTAEAASRANSAVRVRSIIAFAARVASSVNSSVKKIGVSEIRKSAGHFSVSFTQRNSTAYFSGAKSPLNAKRSCGSTVLIRLVLRAVRLFDHAVNMKRPENGYGAFVVGNDHSVAARRDISVIDGGH